MATTERQNRLLVAEDWRKIYQAFQQADFKSYDFETLRRTMVAYLRENSVQRSFQLAKKSANFELWMEIGKAVFNFGLAPKRARS